MHPPSLNQNQSKKETGGAEGGGGGRRTQPHIAGQTSATLEGQGLRKRVGGVTAGKSGSVQREIEGETERDRQREQQGGNLQESRSEEKSGGLCKFPASLQMVGERVGEEAGESGHGQGTLSPPPPSPPPLGFVTAPLHEDDNMDGIANTRYGGGEGGRGGAGGGGGGGERRECREDIVERGRGGGCDADGGSWGWQGGGGRGEDVKAVRDASPVMVKTDRKARLLRNKVTRAHTQDAHTHTPNPEPWPLNGRQKGESAEKHGDTPVQTNSQTQP